MALNINEFKSQLVLGGARPTLFQVQIQNPVNAAGDIKVPFMVKAAQLPASTLGVVEVPYFGRKLKQPGDRTYEPWTVTLINDEDFLIRNAIEQWSHAINSAEGNIRDLQTALQFSSQAQVTQFSKSGVPIREYTFRDIWPSEISAIELGWENNDTIEEFQVTFQMNSWDVTGGVTGNAGGQ